MLQTSAPALPMFEPIDVDPVLDATQRVGDWLPSLKHRLGVAHDIVRLIDGNGATYSEELLVGHMVTGHDPELYAVHSGETQEEVQRAVKWMQIPRQARTHFCGPMRLGQHLFWSWASLLLTCCGLQIRCVLGVTNKSVILEVHHPLLSRVVGEGRLVAKVACDPDWVEKISAYSSSLEQNEMYVSQEASSLLLLQGVIGVPRFIALCQWDSTSVLLTSGIGAPAADIIRNRGNQGLHEIEIEEAADHLIQTIEAIHGRGLCHMDISPFNIVRRGDRWGLVDFASCLPIGQPVPKNYASTYDFASNRVQARQQFIVDGWDDFVSLHWCLTYLRAPRDWGPHNFFDPTEEFARTRKHMWALIKRFSARAREMNGSNA
jgi:serine/threonine protein kinase